MHEVEGGVEGETKRTHPWVCSSLGRAAIMAAVKTGNRSLNEVRLRLTLPGMGKD